MYNEEISDMIKNSFSTMNICLTYMKLLFGIKNIDEKDFLTSYIIILDYPITANKSSLTFYSLT